MYEEGRGFGGPRRLVNCVEQRLPVDGEGRHSDFFSDGLAQ